MTPALEYSQVASVEDGERFASITSQCFTTSRIKSQIYSNLIGKENLRVIRQGEQVLGGLAMIPMGQWFGNERVPMTGIAAVGIAPEYRGTGAALAMMQNAVKELHTQGVPISVLYPAVQHLYRKAGYEQGGNYCIWEIPTGSIQLRQQPLPFIPVDCTPHLLHDLYQKQARLNNGNLDRNQFIWQSMTPTDEQETIYAYLIGTADKPQGYIIFKQEREQHSTNLKVIDWAVLTTAAAQSLWSFLAHHRSLIDSVRWKSSVLDSLTLLLPEQTAKLKTCDRWMLRIVNVTLALEKRGYPVGVQAQLHLEVRDDLLAANNGKFILCVANGRGEVTSGGRGELKLDIRGLAPLYTGLFTPHQLQLAGKLEGEESAFREATQIFAGASPWMGNFF
jgi:predicted acetyltransferase